ncbi:MAG TPA: alpha/beta fold hydrolase [Microbacteriaceae bacterium]|nr:alpha/beta fold hydrolase [Microbacteriaceae bacterium]
MLRPVDLLHHRTSLTDRWQHIVDAVADHVAFSSVDTSYTFAQADTASGHIRGHLALASGGDHETPIGLLAGHDPHALVGLLGIWRAERVAVVLDPHLPEERLRNIAETAGLGIVIADEEHTGVATALVGEGGRVLRLEEILQTEPAARGQAGEPPVRHGTDAAAIVFTSGSTGRPKGVIQTHGGLLNEAYAHGELWGITPEDRVALVFPYSFAAGLYVLCIATLNGAAVHTFDPRDKGVHHLSAWLHDNEISTLHGTPYLIRSLVETLGPNETLDSLRLVSTAGEAIYGTDVRALMPHLTPKASYANWLGSSEMGGFSTFAVHHGDVVPAGPLPAGTPVANKEVTILREDGTEAGRGEIGTVVAISAYLSGGYWHDDEANAARFTPLADGRTACKQGDLGKIDDAGNLILAGRSDAAIKVRGYLVEPSEVEAALLRIDEVTETIVMGVHNPPDPDHLVAYVVCDPQRRAPSVAALRRELRRSLPEYMVPPTIVQLTGLPRTERGKVDRMGLPAPTPVTPSTPPSGGYELVLADIWAEALGLDSVGLDDDFMALGGDSLAVEEALAMVRERLGVYLPSSQLLEAPTLREFHQRVQFSKRSGLPSHPDVVALRDAGEKTPIHCFAGAGALALTFHPLSRHLPGRRVYGYQAHGLERRGLPDHTVAAAARRYLETLRVLQPKGPYILLGHSFGGLVALEVADTLARAGEEVQLVGLLDTYLPASITDSDFDYQRLPGGPHRNARWDLTRQAERWLHRLLPEGIPALADWGRHARSYVAGAIQFDGQDQFDAFFDLLKRVARRHEVHSYAGRTLLVIAENNPDGYEAWRPFLTGPREIVQIASEHTSLLREPYAAELADVVRSRLGEAPDESLSGAESGNEPATDEALAAHQAS